MDTKTCPKCNLSNRIDAKFCRSCGYNFSELGGEVQSQSSTQDKENRLPWWKRLSVWISVIVLFVLCLICLAVLGYQYWNNYRDEQNTQKTQTAVALTKQSFDVTDDLQMTQTQVQIQITQVASTQIIPTITQDGVFFEITTNANCREDLFEYNPTNLIDTIDEGARLPILASRKSILGDVWFFVSVDLPNSDVNCCWIRSDLGDVEGDQKNVPKIDYLPDIRECNID